MNDTSITTPFAVWKTVPRMMPLLHRHEAFEVNYICSSGWLEYRFPAGIYRLEAGSVWLFWGNTPHQLVKSSGKTEYICMTLPVSWLHPRGFHELLGRFNPVHHPIMKLSPPGPYKELFHTWAVEFATGTEAEVLSQIMNEVDCWLKRSIRQVSEPTPLRSWSSTNAALEDQLLHLATDLYRAEDNILKIAAKSGYNPTYALGIFKQAFGITLGQYVTHLRISHACSQLTLTDLPVSTIALDAGFQSLSSFYRVFFRNTGKKPLKYRKESRET